MNPNRSGGGRRAVGCAGLILAVPVGLLVLFGLLWAAGAFLITADPLEPADAVIVLSGGGEDRVAYAAEVFQQTGARVFIITETNTGTPGSPRTSAIDSRTAQAAGVPTGAIYITRLDVVDTRDEARAARDAVERFSARSLIVVTDPFHTRRTRIVFNRALADQIDVRISAVAGHSYRSRDWFLSLSGWQMTAREYFSLLGLLVGR